MRIFASREYLPTGIPHVTMLYPFWGFPESEAAPNVYARFIETGAHLFEIVPAKAADAFVLPFDWRYTTRAFARTSNEAAAARLLAERFADLAADLGKMVVVFFVSDSDEEVTLPNSLVLRTSLHHGRRPNEFAMAVFIEDIVGQELAPDLPLRPKLPTPTVGFCGFAGYRLLPDVSVGRKIRSWVRWAYRRFPPASVRELAITNLRRMPGVNTNFLLREHAKGKSLPEAAREEFQRNLLNSDYVICARGWGNWSIRFYETLSFGRIPLFVDTHCGLPYDFEIDYKRYCVWVQASQLETTAEQLLEFHSKLDGSDFKELQQACRQLWEERLTPHGFFSHLPEILAQRVPEAFVAGPDDVPNGSV